MGDRGSAVSTPTYELVDKGTCWAAVRNGTDVFCTWDREADPLNPNRGLLWQMTTLVQQRWGRVPTWVQTDTGWRAT